MTGKRRKYTNDGALKTALQSARLLLYSSVAYLILAVQARIFLFVAGVVKKHPKGTFVGRISTCLSSHLRVSQ